MRLNKITSYALRILIHCGQHPGEIVKASDIAGAYQITEANIFKVVQLLVRAGLIETIRGPAGGLRLARPATEVRIGDILRATEETRIQAQCFGQGFEDCAISRETPINRVFETALDAFIEVLDAHTLDEFIKARPGSDFFEHHGVSKTTPPIRPTLDTV